MPECHHNWVGMTDGKRLACHNCHTVTEIRVLIDNTATAAAHKAKINLLSKQLYARELKKDAHDAAYAWIKHNTPAGTLLEPEPSKQSVLL